MLLLYLLSCDSEAGERVLPVRDDAPVVPDLPGTPWIGQSRAYEMDLEGGAGGAPLGTRFLFPPGAAGLGTTGPLSDGSLGATFTVDVPGNAVFCTDALRLAGKATLTTRMRVSSLNGQGDARAAVEIELRSRDEANKPIAGDGRAFPLVHRIRAQGDFEDVTEEIEIPAGALKGEMCWRFVHATGTIEVDRVEVLTPGVALSDKATVVGVRWELDTDGGTYGAPAGFAFLIPPGTKGATLVRVDGGIRIGVAQQGNAVACSDPVSVAAGMRARGRFRVLSVETEPGVKTGFMAELRTYDLVGRLASAGRVAYTNVVTAIAPTEWTEFERPITPPEGAVTGKLCFRFAKATGVAEVDWGSLGE